jgi:hypothetical protein
MKIVSSTLKINTKKGNNFSHIAPNIGEQIFRNRIVKKKWLTTAELAIYLGCTVAAVRNRVYRGQLKANKPFGINGKCYFDKGEVDLVMNCLGGIYD